MNGKSKKVEEMTDAELKEHLLELAKSGAPMPSKNSFLGKALARFTTKPERPKMKAAGKPHIIGWAAMVPDMTGAKTMISDSDYQMYELKDGTFVFVNDGIARHYSREEVIAVRDVVLGK